jgi:uncharacterized membrane protein YdjX (TVP38/TMEM64 family)
LQSDGEFKVAVYSMKSWIRHAAWTVAVIGLLYVAWSVWSRDASLIWLQRARPVPFFSAMALLPLIGFPITPFFVLAGALFDVRLGVIGAVIALGCNLAACYFLARKLRPSLERLLRRLDRQLPNAGSGTWKAIRFTMTVKLTPGVPAFIKNYSVAIAGVAFLPYFFSSLLITGVYGVAVLVLGDSLLNHDRGQILKVGAVLAVLALGAWWWRRRHVKEEGQVIGS